VSNTNPDFTIDPDEFNQGGQDTQPDGEASHTDAIDAVLEATQEPSDDSPDAELSRMKHDVELANQRVLLAQAELENFRKRTRKDYEDQLRFAALPLIEDLLQVRDNLMRALEAANTAAGSVESLQAGVNMVAKQLDDILAKHGIRPIPSIGETFDPNYHQAIAQAPSETHELGTIAIEATTGFQMHGRVVRPSQVVVSTGKPGQAAE
jgi:molecular chaperone GrpE